MKKLLLLMLMTCLFLVSIDAQKVTGTVVGSEDNAPLPGVSVVVKGTAQGTITDIDGMFSLNATAQDVLTFSFIGFESQNITVGANASMKVTLQVSANLLEEAVVTAYGGSVKKKESTGANSNLRGQVIENLAVQSFDKAMQGRMAGVQNKLGERCAGWRGSSENQRCRLNYGG